jgi:hypothetical protein
MQEIKYLYHYTSIETLALILKNKNIRFNRLDRVDDLEEGQTADYGAIGRFFFVSCWTAESEESIPMWKMYTPDMKGVRVKIPVDPFKKYNYKKGEFICKNLIQVPEDMEANIDLCEHYNKYEYHMVTTYVKHKELQYTDEKDKIYPSIFSSKTKTDPNNTGKLINDVHLDFKLIGKYKKSYWAFQKEYRYIITISAFNIKETLDAANYENQLSYLINKYKSSNLTFLDYYLKIDEEKYKDMEILLGPKVSEGQRIIVRALIDKYNPGIEIKNSNIKIR